MSTLAFGQPDNGIIQMAYTVANLDQAMRDFTANLQVGPWFIFRRLAGNNPLYRGQRLAANDMALGFAGNMQIELIQPLDDHPSVYRETILERDHGFHHFGLAARDFDDACAGRAKAINWPLPMPSKAWGRSPISIRWPSARHARTDRSECGARSHVQ
jgi:hypothetical protein